MCELPIKARNTTEHVNNKFKKVDTSTTPQVAKGNPTEKPNYITVKSILLMSALTQRNVTLIGKTSKVGLGGAPGRERERFAHKRPR